MAFSGAKEKLEFVVDMNTRAATAAAQKFGDEAEKAANKASSSFERVGSKMQAVGVGMVGAAVAVGTGLGKMAMAADEAQRQHLRLTTAIANSSDAASFNVAALDEQANALQQTADADGDAVSATQGFLVTLGLTQDQILNLTPLINDYAHMTGVDLQTAALQVTQAINGKQRALERVLGPLKDTSDATEGYAVVSDALNEKVAGTGEVIAGTFSGQLNRLRINLGDVAEGIGSGVIPALESMLSPLQSATTWFTHLDGGTQKAVGSFATYGTAAVGAVGGLSVLAGSTAKMVSRFTSVAGEGEEATRSLNGFGKVAAGIALIGLIAGLKQMSDEITGLHLNIDGLAGATSDQLDSVALSLQGVADRGYTSMQAIADQVVSQNVPAAERLADAFDRQGLSSEVLRNRIEQQRQTDAQAQVDTAQYAQETDNLAGSLGGAADAADGTTSAFADSADAAANNADAIDALRGAADEAAQAVDRLYGATVQGTDAEADFQSSLDDLASTLSTGSQELDLNTEKGRENYQAARDAADAINEKIGVLIQEGASTADATAMGEAYTEQLRQQLRQSGLTEDQVASYISTLHLTPDEIRTRIEAAGVQTQQQFVEQYHGALDRLPEDQRTLIRALIDGGAYDRAASLIDQLARDRVVKLKASVQGTFLGGFAGSASGGYAGEGTFGPSDTIPTLLTPGEYVINKDAAADLGPGVLNALNNGVVPTTGTSSSSAAVAAGGDVHFHIAQVVANNPEALVDQLRVYARRNGKAFFQELAS